jgi:hypothetical protein
MTKDESITSSLNTFGHEDLHGFANYLGMSYEELIEIQKKNFESQVEYLRGQEGDQL